MAVICAGWDLAELVSATNIYTLEFTDNTGTYSFNLTASGTYCHVDLQSAMGTGSYDDFATYLKTQMEALSGRTYTISFSSTTGLYSFQVDAGTVTFTTNTTTLMRGLLGFNSLPATSTGAPSTLSSQIIPYYAIVTQIDGQSSVTDDYEPAGFSFDGETDDGSSYGISRETAPTYYDWVQMMESKEAVFTRAAASTAPWTYQHLFRHCRNVHPIYYANTANLDQATYKLRAEGAHWAPQRVTADYDGQWNIPFRCRVVGR